MIELFITLLLIGLALVAFGIYRAKTYYGQQTFTEAEVVGYERYKGGTGLYGAAVTTMSAIAGMVHPVVDIRMPNGAIHTVKLHDTTSTGLIDSRYPELQVGGKVSVMYFGSDPKEAYLTNHEIAQTVMKTSPALIVGIAVLAVAVIMLVAMIVFSNSL